MSQNRSSKGIWILIGIVGIFMLMFFLFGVFAMKGLNSSSLSINSDNPFQAITDNDAPIAVVEVKGVIMESDKTIKLLHKAEKNDSVKAIILRIDSPGGAVGPTQEIYEEIIRIDEQKPIYASFSSVAASGGYYLGAACRKIFSNAGTITGSIGVIMQFMDMSKLYKWAKLKPETIKAGKYKDIGNPARSMTKDERSFMDAMITKVHQQFIDDIMRRRSHVIKKDIYELAQGQIFSGQEAKELGLIDEVAGLWKAGRMIHEELKFKEKFDLRFIKKKKKFQMMSLFEDLEDEARLLLNQTGETPMFLYK